MQRLRMKRIPAIILVIPFLVLRHRPLPDAQKARLSVNVHNVLRLYSVQKSSEEVPLSFFRFSRYYAPAPVDFFFVLMVAA